MESYGLQPKWPRLPFVGLDFLPQFCYFGHNFLTKMLESQPMTLKDWYYSLFSNKNFESINWLLAPSDLS